MRAYGQKTSEGAASAVCNGGSVRKSQQKSARSNNFRLSGKRLGEICALVPCVTSNLLGTARCGGDRIGHRASAWPVRAVRPGGVAPGLLLGRVGANGAPVFSRVGKQPCQTICAYAVQGPLEGLTAKPTGGPAKDSIGQPDPKSDRSIRSNRSITRSVKTALAVPDLLRGQALHPTLRPGAIWPDQLNSVAIVEQAAARKPVAR